LGVSAGDHEIEAHLQQFAGPLAIAAEDAGKFAMRAAACDQVP
jgi:hypothetical protein